MEHLASPRQLHFGSGSINITTQSHDYFFYSMYVEKSYLEKSYLETCYLATTDDIYYLLQDADIFTITVIFHQGLQTSNFLLDDLTYSFYDNLDLTDTSLVSATGEEIPCHRYMYYYYFLNCRSPCIF